MPGQWAGLRNSCPGGSILVDLISDAGRLVFRPSWIGGVRETRPDLPHLFPDGVVLRHGLLVHGGGHVEKQGNVAGVAASSVAALNHVCELVVPELPGVVLQDFVDGVSEHHLGQFLAGVLFAILTLLRTPELQYP